MSKERFINQLLWMAATNAESFHPAKDTAWNCIENVLPNHRDDCDTDEKLLLDVLRAYEWEVGQHTREIQNAVMLFERAEKYGLCPVERVAREHYDLIQKTDAVEPIDWSWLSKHSM
jgi:hypothetical protein